MGYSTVYIGRLRTMKANSVVLEKMNSLLLFFGFTFLSGGLCMHHNATDEEWSYFIFGASCNLETLKSDGQYDLPKSEACGKCLEKIGTVLETGEGPEVLRNCTSEFMPNIASHCETTLNEEVEFGQYWENILKCFYDYVSITDVDGRIQKDMKEWIKDHPLESVLKESREKEWEYLVGSSCIAEARKDDGSYDFMRSDECGECFEEDEEKFKECTDEFLPNMTTCAEILYTEGETKALVCFEEHLEKVDVSGEARRIMKEYLAEQNTWTGWFYKAWAYIKSLFT